MQISKKISNLNFLTKALQSNHQEMISFNKRFHVFPLYRTMFHIKTYGCFFPSQSTEVSSALTTYLLSFFSTMALASLLCS